MRVLVVTDRWDLIGGSERYAREVVQGLSTRGIQVRVLCSASGEASACGEAAGVERGAPGANAPEQILACDGLSSARLSRPQAAELRAALFGCDRTLVLSRVSSQALSVLLAGPPLLRFVQDHTLFCPSLNKLRADLRVCEEPLGVACLRNYWLDGGCSGQQIQGAPALLRPIKTLGRAWTELRLLQGARRLIVASAYMAGELERAGLHPGRIDVLPYFTQSNTGAIRPAPLPDPVRAFWSAPNAFKLLTPARLVLPDKGIDYLLTALGKLGGDVRLVIAGEGPARAWIEQKAKDEGLAQRVLFSGWCSAEVLEGLYAAAHLVAFPSIWNEPFGLVGIEAMAHGKAVVAFDVGGVREWLVEEETGSLVESRDASGFARAIARFHGNEPLARRFGEAGRERVAQHFARSRHLDRLVQLLEESA